MVRFDWNGQTTADEHVDTSEKIQIYVNGQSRVKLTGSASGVVIELVDGQSLLDLSTFVTPEVVTIGKIDGQSHVFLGSNGEIVFNDKIDGQSLVIARASGRIEFNEKIDGGSRVVYSSGGSVRGPLVNGRSVVLWHGRPPAFTKIDGGSVVSSAPDYLSGNQGD